jgi:DNA-binding NarL/FixJ family response regulator
LQRSANVVRRAGFLIRVPVGTADQRPDADVTVLWRAGDRESQARETSRLKTSTAVVSVVSANRLDVGVAVRAGARGVVLADRLDATLPATIRAVHAGQLTLPREFRRLIAKPALSHREREVLRLVVLGASNTEIGAALCLEASTVKSHVSTVLAKLGANGRRQAAFMVLDPQSGFGASILDLPVHRVEPRSNV